MEFKTLFQVLRKHLSDGNDVPYFFRDLMAMLTTVSEEEWGSPIDPSTRRVKDETLRNYSKRGIPAKFAQNIVYHLTPEVFIEAVNERDAVVRENLANDLKGYDSSINAGNVATKVFSWLSEMIHRFAGLTEQTILEKEQQIELAQSLKKKYGEYLLDEIGDYCAFPGCGKRIVFAKDGKTSAAYEVTKIAKDKPPTIDNLLAVCPQCFSVYQIDSNPKITKELGEVKKMVCSRKITGSLLDEMPLERGIVRVIKRITMLKEKDLADAQLDPKEIQDKLRPSDDMALYLTVKSYVTMYFIKIRDILRNADKKGEIDYEQVQDQMKAIYRRLKKAKKSNAQIFNSIVEKVQHVSLQDTPYCQIVVSFFIQSCEVFDAIS